MALFILLAVVMVCVIAIDRVARRGGAYIDTNIAWPAMVKLRPRRVDGSQAYRTWFPHDIVHRVPEGVPALVSVPVLIMMLLNLCWAIAALLGTCDLLEAFRGRRSLGFTVTSLGWCTLRAVFGWLPVSAAMFRQPRHFVLAATAIALMDLLLMLYPIPCSDVRREDESMARAGLVTAFALAVGFGIAHWRRHGAIPLDQYRTMH